MIFPHPLLGGVGIDPFEVTTFETAPELVMVLIDAHDPLEKAVSVDKIASIS